MFLIGFEASATLGLYIVSAILLAGLEMRREFVRGGRLSLPAGTRAVARSACTVVLGLMLHWTAWRHLVGERWYEVETLSSLYMRHVVLCVICVLAAYTAVAGVGAILRTALRRSSTAASRPQ